MTYLSRNIVIGYTIGVLIAMMATAFLQKNYLLMFKITVHFVLGMLLAMILPKFTGEDKR